MSVDATAGDLVFQGSVAGFFDAKGIEFLAEDLDLLGAPPRWVRQEILVDRLLLARLEAVASGWNQGRPWRRYAGTVDGTSGEITLRMDLMLPERIVTRRDRTDLRRNLLGEPRIQKVVRNRQPLADLHQEEQPLIPGEFPHSAPEPNPAVQPQPSWFSGFPACRSRA